MSSTAETLALAPQAPPSPVAESRGAESRPGPRPAARSLLAAIGKTPLVELDFAGDLPAGTRLFAKLESCNPGASIKDRPVARMMSEAMRRGIFRHGRRLLDSSSGNAAIAYAQLGAILGVGVTLVIPGNASQERLQRIAAYGAELILTDPLEGYDYAVNTARRLGEEHPERYWYSNQYANDDNWRAHFETTGYEILEQVHAQTGSPPDAFIAGIGTGGTITGVGRRLRRANPGLHVACVIPEIFPGIEGLKPFGHPGDLVPEILDQSLIDERLELTLDDAVAMARRLGEQGLFVGPSSGAFVEAALRVASTGRFRTIVTVLSDTGERYGSTGMWETAEEVARL